MEIQALGDSLRRDLEQANLAVASACRSINSILLQAAGNMSELASHVVQVNDLMSTTILTPGQREFSNTVSEWIENLTHLIEKAPCLIQPPPPPVPSYEPPPGKSLRVLVAENNRINQELAIACLEAAGHTFDIANNGLEAVEAARTNAYDAVLMDLGMPELGGLEATARIRAFPDVGANVPIIAVTASDVANDQQVWAQAGITDCVSKPFVPSALLAKLQQVCTRPHALKV